MLWERSRGDHKISFGRAQAMHFLFKRFRRIGLLFFLFLFATAAGAETMYVSDMLKLTLRTGPSTENKILAVIESGQQMELLEAGEEWSRVKLPNGKEGWVLSRYLTPVETSNVKLERLQVQYQNLTEQAAELLEENKMLKAENEKLRAEFEANQAEMGKTRADYEALKAEAAEFLSLKSKYTTAVSQLTEQSDKAKKLEEQLAQLEMNSYIKWFLAGSGVLFVGFIIGFSTKRQRRRSPLLG
jgi:SH3 domain protein